MQRFREDEEDDEDELEFKDPSSSFPMEQNMMEAAQESQNLLGMSSNFQTEVIIQKYNPYASVLVSGPKWSKEGG